jgi:uncharacterized membrane protein YfcA
MDVHPALLLLACGAAAGTVGSMLGIGGGLIVIPVLTNLFQFQFDQARATGLVVVAATSCAVAAFTARERAGNLRLGILLSVPTAAVALANAVLFYKLDSTILFFLFAGILVVVAGLMWRPEPSESDEKIEDAVDTRALDGFYFDSRLGREVHYRVKRIPILAGVSATAGAVSGLLGVGGGVFQVPAMNLLGRVPIRAAAATSNFILGVTAAASLPKYLTAGHLRPIETAAIVLGVIPGAFLGTGIARRVHGTLLRRAFSGVVLFLAYTMVQKALT